MASRIELEVAHDLPIEEAHARMLALGEYYHHRHGAVVTWADHQGDIAVRYLGIKLHVRVLVEARRVHCEAPDPGFLLRKRGIEYLRKKIARYLDPATAVDALPRR
ncbi:MAG: polyhydroxyalkanoic acid system family protein [Deltaproteobacteria bacterium]|nr:polyhydroxyalkanoic acid system family protein [Deltaproteobacteria bacterium]